MMRWREMSEAERRQAEREIWFYLPEDRGRRIEGRVLQIWLGRWRDLWESTHVEGAA
jgi:hypothetical protein